MRVATPIAAHEKRKNPRLGAPCDLPSGNPLACLPGLSSSSLVVPRWSVLDSLVLRVLSVVDMRGVIRWIRTTPCSDPALDRDSRSRYGFLLALVAALGLTCFRFGQIRSPGIRGWPLASLPIRFLSWPDGLSRWWAPRHSLQTSVGLC